MRSTLTLVVAFILLTSSLFAQAMTTPKTLVADGEFHQPWAAHDVEYLFERVVCEGEPITPVTGVVKLIQYLDGRKILCFEVDDPKTRLIVRDNEPNPNLVVEVKSTGDKSDIQLIGSDGVHGSGNGVSSSGDGSTVTVDGNDHDIDITGEDSGVTVYGDGNDIEITGEADGTGLDVDGDDNTIKIGKSGAGSNDDSGATVTGKDNLIRVGDTENLDVDINGDDNTVRIAPGGNNGSYDLSPTSDGNRATDNGTNNSHTSSGGTGNKWNGGRW